MAARPFTNAQILVAINQIKINSTSKGGSQLGGTDDQPITKKDVMDTLFLLLYFQKKAQGAPPGAPLPSSSKTDSVIDTPTGGNYVSALKLDFAINTHDNATYIDALKITVDAILKNIPSNIDGTTPHIDNHKKITNSFYAKQNLARILYFLALDACDALTYSERAKPAYGTSHNYSNDFKRFSLNQTTKDSKTTSASYSTKINQTYYQYIQNISNYRKLFIIASTVADNVVLQQSPTKVDAATSTVNITPELCFFDVGDTTKKGVVKLDNDLIDTSKLDDFTNMVNGSYSGDNPINNITFKTTFPKIFEQPDVTVNLRVIQTILIGHNVFNDDDYNKLESILKSDTQLQSSVNNIVNDLLSKYYIDISISNTVIS